MTINVPVLSAKLQDFGLDPRHWILETQEERGGLFQIFLYSRLDPELIFEGWAERERWLLLSLSTFT